MLFDHGSGQLGEPDLFVHRQAQASAEPPGVASPAGPDFGDPPLLSPERHPDASPDEDRLLALPDGDRRRAAGETLLKRSAVLLDDGLGPPGELLLLGAGEAAVPAVPVPVPDGHLGDDPLLAVNGQGDAAPPGPAHDRKRLPAGEDRYLRLHGFPLPPGRSPCLPGCDPSSKGHRWAGHFRIGSRFFSQRAQPSLSVVLVGDCSRSGGPSTAEGGVGVSPTGED